MVIAAVLCLCPGRAGRRDGTVGTLTRRPPVDLTGQVLRLVAPTRIAAAIMLAAGAVAALAAPPGSGPSA